MDISIDEKEEIQRFLIDKCKETLGEYPAEEVIYQKLLVIVTEKCKI